jgi:hypothetical protein
MGRVVKAGLMHLDLHQLRLSWTQLLWDGQHSEYQNPYPSTGLFAKSSGSTQLFIGYNLDRGCGQGSI